MSNREIFIDKLRQLSKEEMLERYIALLNTEKLTDYVADLEAKLAENEKKHLLDENEWQDYCAYKIIEPQIKGCLDREMSYIKFLENFEDYVNHFIAKNPRVDKYGMVKEIIENIRWELYLLRNGK